MRPFERTILKWKGGSTPLSRYSVWKRVSKNRHNGFLDPGVSADDLVAKSGLFGLSDACGKSSTETHIAAALY